MRRTSHMRRFWDARARENPWFFINNALDYHETDVARFWQSGEEDLEMVLGRLGASLRPDDHVVEIGCGAGRMTRAIARKAGRVTALDVAPRMLAIAREQNDRLDNVDWLLGDGTSLAGVADASADACISYVVLQHLPDPELALGYVREMARVLRPGGWAAFQISNDPAPHRKRPQGPRRRLASLRGAMPKGQRDPAWCGSYVEIADLRATCEDAGLALERVTGEGTQLCLVLARRRAPTN